MNESSQPGSTSRRRWLCVAYAFPPVGRSGTHRTLGFVRHLDRLGWDATVLTARLGDEPLDHELSNLVPARTEIVRAPWIDFVRQAKRIVRWSAPRPRQASVGGSGLNNAPAKGGNGRSGRLREWVSRLLMTPDSRIGWVPAAVREGLRCIRRDRPDVIYSTSPYTSAHLIALALCRLSRIPWVADFRDPWTGNPFRELGFSSIERWDAWLERAVLGRASAIVCNTPTLTQRFARLHPLVAPKCTTILNGFDADRFVGLTPKRLAPDSEFVLTHCGQFYGPRSPLVWFAAIKHALQRLPTRVAGFHVVLIGPDTYDGRKLSDWAADMGIGDRVHVLGVKTHSEALAYAAGSDALMLAGSSGVGGALQIPGKLFEYLALRKPILATCCADSPIVDILRRARAETIVCEPDDVRAQADAMVRLASGGLNCFGRSWRGVDAFERAHRAAELAALFARVSGDGSPAGRVLTSATLDVDPAQANSRHLGQPVPAAVSSSAKAIRTSG